jgi:hypothetical protein
MGSTSDAIRRATTADDGVREAVQDQELSWILASSACELCTRFLLASERRDCAQTDMEREHYRAARLLFVLAALEVGPPPDDLEALRLIGARHVDARGLKAKQRFRRAGEARVRPILSERHYERSGHLVRMQQRLADELYELITQPDRLDQALAKHGERAVSIYV